MGTQSFWSESGMGSKSSIEWTDATWNPVRGCSMAKGSETGGCLNCYAARLNARNLPEMKSPTTGEPFARILQSGPRWTGKVELIEKALMLPLKWRSPKRIFVNSLSDLFHEALPDEAIDRVFAVMALCPHHTFQVLTKRPERMRAYLSESDLEDRLTEIWAEDNADRQTWSLMLPLRNVWLGVSVENQATADARIPLLLQTPAAKRFISYEPALGPVNIEPFVCADWRDGTKDALPKPDWVIVGGESGPGARPMHPEWVRSIRDQCTAAGVAFFFKQWGEYGAVTVDDRCGKIEPNERRELWIHADGHTSNRWEFAWPMVRVGKKKSGALLDGREWREFPI